MEDTVNRKSRRQPSPPIVPASCRNVGKIGLVARGGLGAVWWA
jgi:hypothetical protein